MYVRVVLFSKIARYPGAHLTQLTLYPPKWKSTIRGVGYYKKSSAQPCQSLCTVSMYCEGIGIVGEITLFSKIFRILLKHSLISIADPIIRGVVEVTFCAISPLNGSFWDFLLWSTISTALHNKKSPKRPFRGEISQKVTSKTPLIIGFYIRIVECFRKNRKFLLHKL